MDLVHSPKVLLSQTHSVYTVKIIDILIISLINRITLTAGSLRPESQNTAECLQSFMASCDFLIKQSLSWRTKANFMWGWSIIIDWCHVVASRPMIKSAQWGNRKTDIAAGSLKSVILPFNPSCVERWHSSASAVERHRATLSTHICAPKYEKEKDFVRVWTKEGCRRGRHRDRVAIFGLWCQMSWMLPPIISDYL